MVVWASEVERASGNTVDVLGVGLNKPKVRNTAGENRRADAVGENTCGVGVGGGHQFDQITSFE
jgi:hypothetical protein